MGEQRVHARYACTRTVEAGFFRGQRCCGARQATVSDISEGGLLLQFDTQPPDCDRIVVYTGGLELAYEVRHSFQKDGIFFAGLQLLK